MEIRVRFIWFLCGVGSFHPFGISGEWEVHELFTSGSSWMKRQCSTLWFSLLKFVCFSMYSMNHKAPRRYSQGRDFGVDRQQDFAADIVPRRSSIPYDKRVKKSPYNGSRNLVWMSKEFQASEGNRPRKNDAYRSPNSPVSSTGYHVSNQPRKNDAYRSMNSPVSGTGNRVSNQPSKNVVYGSRSSSISGSRVWRLGDNSSPKFRECVCKYWKAGNCKKGEQCEFLHSWCCFPGLVMVATLEGHKKDIKGIALPQGSDKLYSASGDGALRIWDCHTGQCVHEINLQAEAGSLISEGPWDFLGLPNAVKEEVRLMQWLLETECFLLGQVLVVYQSGKVPTPSLILSNTSHLLRDIVAKSSVSLFEVRGYTLVLWIKP